MRSIHEQALTLLLGAATALGCSAAPRIAGDSGPHSSGNGAWGAPAPICSNTADHRALTLTIYQNGLALVHDRRQVSLSAHCQRLTVLDLPLRLQADSVAVSLAGDAQVLRQRFRTGEWTPSRLLQAYQGREVLLVPRTGESGSERRGRLISASGGIPIVRVGERLEMGGHDAPWRIAFPSNPQVSLAGPSLELWLSNAAVGRHDLNLIYLVDGLGWQMDYLAELEGDHLRLDGFAQVTNHSGGDYPHASLRLMAGEVARSPRAVPALGQQERMQASAVTPSESVFAWHLYRPRQPASLADSSVLRLRLLQADGFKAQRRYRVSGNATGSGGATPVRVRIHVSTDASAHPPALPAGTVRVLDRGRGGEPRYLGAVRIGNTPAGSPLELVLGTAFDLTAQRTREQFLRLGKDHYEVGWRIELHNAGSRPSVVEVREHLSGDWKIVQQSARHVRLSAETAQWKVIVPASGTATLRYRARYSR